MNGKNIPDKKKSTISIEGWKNSFWGSKYFNVKIETPYSFFFSEIRFSNHDSAGNFYSENYLPSPVFKIRDGIYFSEEDNEICVFSLKWNFKTIRKMMLNNIFILNLIFIKNGILVDEYKRKGGYV